MLRLLQRFRRRIVVLWMLLLSYSSTTTLVHGKISTISNTFFEKISGLDDELSISLLWPGWVGYIGWNYESAVALQALIELSSVSSFVYNIDEDDKAPQQQIQKPIQQQHQKIINNIDKLLASGTTLPQPGYFISKAKFPVIWFYSPGDRIGLFADLYSSHSNQYNDIYCYAKTYLMENWPTTQRDHEEGEGGHGCFKRYVGWLGASKILPFGLTLSGYNWVWADDVYIGGAIYLKDHPDFVLQMLHNGKKLLKDNSGDNLWWHGVKLITNIKDKDNNSSMIIPNGIKWGRGNAWVLLMLSRYVYSRTTMNNDDIEAIEWLHEELLNYHKYQRTSGAFGNIINDNNSPDESSLTSTYIYGVGVLLLQELRIQYLYNQNTTSIKSNISLFFDRKKETQELSLSLLRDSALAAWDWLNNITIKVEEDEESKIKMQIDNTCSSAHLSQDSNYYNEKVGFSGGPAIGLTIWAEIGYSYIQLYNNNNNTNSSITTPHNKNIKDNGFLGGDGNNKIEGSLIVSEWLSEIQRQQSARPTDCSMVSLSYSGLFYFLIVLGCIIMITLCGLCCMKCPCCIRFRRQRYCRYCCCSEQQINNDDDKDNKDEDSDDDISEWSC